MASSNLFERENALNKSIAVVMSLVSVDVFRLPTSTSVLTESVCIFLNVEVF